MKQSISATMKRVTCALLISVVFIHWTSFTAFADPDEMTHIYFIPLVIHDSTSVHVIPPPSTCKLNAQEKAIEVLFQNQPDQKRTTFQCNPILSAVARARAEDMGRRNYFGHVNPEQQGPNYLVRSAGYVLPEYYSTELSANNIESIGAGARDAEGMWNAWMQSSSHRVHLLGEEDFYREQTDYGIGFAHVPGSDYQYYWVFISAKPVE